MSDVDVEKIKKSLRESRQVKNPLIKKSDLLSTGSTLLNLACTGTIYGGFSKRRYFFFIGGSVTGKTFIALTCFAEASINPNFDNYRFIYDNVEDGALMDFVKFFGKKAAERIEPPARDEDGKPIYSRTAEDMYFNLDDAIKYAKKHNKPFIWLEDSLDALSSEYEGKKFEERKTARRRGTKAKGDYGDGKAKINSANIRRIMAGLRDTGSILILISQTRDNVGAGLFEPTETRSGGRALKFYATLEIWLSVKKRLTKEVKGKKRQIGILAKISVKKNRNTGKERVVEIPIYHSFGIDDVGSCVDYLIDEGHWKVSGGTINATDFEFKGKIEKLIKYIEEECLEKKLRKLVQLVWNSIEEKCVVVRKPRY